MSSRHQLLYAWPVVRGAVVLVLGGVLAGATVPAWLGWHGADARAAREAPPPHNLPATPSQENLQVAAVEMAAPDAPIDATYANYDEIIVDVLSDGSISVLGDPMGLAAFKSVLRDQRLESWKTVVMIRPAENCPYRHIGPVISACDDCGVPHQIKGTLVTDAESNATAPSPSRNA